MKNIFCKLIFITLFINLSVFQALRSQTLKAVDDTIDLYPGIPKIVNLLENDTIPAGDSLKIMGGNASGPNPIFMTDLHLGFFSYLVVPYWGFNGNATGIYIIIDYTTGKTSKANILFRVHDRSYDTLCINNVKAAITASGGEFILWGSDLTLFRVPRDSENGTFFTLAPWIGGKGEDGTLYLAGERYRQGPLIGTAGLNPDFYAGPVMDSVNYSIFQDTAWYRVWKVRKSEVEYHKIHWNEQGYTAPQNIISWPGNGTVAYGQAPDLAPYHDSNSDGKYDASDGDYPAIPGDEAIFAIFNDHRDIHKETYGNKMKIEIHAMAYAFNIPEDSALKNTIFFNYRIFNRSDVTYYDTYLGIFSDLDIGDPLDDFICCDVERSSFIGYNGTSTDWRYGPHPPAQSVTVLSGPYMDPEGYDRPKTDPAGNQLCNESVNGTGFGDSIADNERYGITNFLSLKNPLGQYYIMSDPHYDYQYFNFMHSFWLDSTRLYYGGIGHPDHGGYGPDCRFMYPGESDSMNWGTGCKVPNGPVNWTPETAGDLPDDIRGIASMGPFTFRPGAIQELDIALIYARDYSENDTVTPSLEKMRKMIDIVRSTYYTGILPNGKPFLGLEKKLGNSIPSVKIYPNPANDKLNIIFSKPLFEQAEIQVINIAGNLVLSESVSLSGRSCIKDISGLHPGIYIIRIRTKNFITERKVAFIK